MKKVVVTPAFGSYPRDWHFSPGIDTGDFVFFSGITGTRADASIAEALKRSFATRSASCAQICFRLAARSATSWT